MKNAPLIAVLLICVTVFALLIGMTISVSAHPSTSASAQTPSTPATAQTQSTSAAAQTPSASGTEQTPSTPCEVTISAPTGEEPVGAQGDVVGTAKIPKNSFLWLFARRDDQPRNFLWPQQGIAAGDLAPSAAGAPRYAGSVHYGERPDTDKLFRVILVVVDPLENQKLEKWREEAPENNYKPWIGLPRSVEGCTPVQVVVKKVEH
jgi:hypothetical protein